jgi:hypothetical protein
MNNRLFGDGTLRDHIRTFIAQNSLMTRYPDQLYLDIWQCQHVSCDWTRRNGPAHLSPHLDDLLAQITYPQCDSLPRLSRDSSGLLTRRIVPNLSTARKELKQLECPLPAVRATIALPEFFLTGATNEELEITHSRYKGQDEPPSILLEALNVVPGLKVTVSRRALISTCTHLGVDAQSAPNKEQLRQQSIRCCDTFTHQLVGGGPCQLEFELK